MVLCAIVAAIQYTLLTKPLPRWARASVVIPVAGGAVILAYDGLISLTPVYEGFTEGFDSQDLKEAKALLDQQE